ncbi:13213_t:CDS:1, partial [Gigaspora margarita]
ETDNLERIIIELGQDKVDHIDWEKVWNHWVSSIGNNRSKKQLHE